MVLLAAPLSRTRDLGGTPIPPTPQPLSQRSNPKCIPLLGFVFSHVPYWQKPDILVGVSVTMAKRHKHITLRESTLEIWTSL